MALMSGTHTFTFPFTYTHTHTGTGKLTKLNSTLSFRFHQVLSYKEDLKETTTSPKGVRATKQETEERRVRQTHMNTLVHLFIHVLCPDSKENGM